ncbi:MAG: hypothetical protein ACR2QK_09170, partial [Acidimicrobiales bacterium]
FSRRVMANLGYGPDSLEAVAPRASLLSLKAFPVGSPEQDWLAFGPGVHAASGLGFAPTIGPTPAPAPTPTATPAPTPAPAPVAYPDLLTGLAGFGTALELLGSDRRRRHAEVSLLGSIQPLVDLAAASAAESTEPGDG